MKITQFNVIPNVPDKLKALNDISMNMWFTWNWEAIELYVRLDAALWEKSYQNPIWTLGAIAQEKLERAASDKNYLDMLDKVASKFKSYLEGPHWFSKKHPDEKQLLIAYFSMEFGIGEGIPIYSGGLGVLSGDHLKTSSDLGLPLVGVGLLYQQGYLQQYLQRDGWQLERYPENDWYNMPVRIEKDPLGKPLQVTVELGHESVKVQVWRVPVGRTSLYLLDTNIAENPPYLREITSRLYGGDREMRMRQEIVLGVGGCRALAALGLKPTVFHMNEGHSAFLALERLRTTMAEHNMTFAEARELVWATNVFTTHTPVPAGNEHFEPGLVQKYMEPVAGRLGLRWDEFLALGQEEPGRSPTYCMTVLALKLAAYLNGVAELHGEVSRAMWQKIWPGLPVHEIPIGSITNGIHTRSWISHDHGDLFERYLGPAFEEDPADPAVWAKLKTVPDEELWAVHQLRKAKLVAFARKRLKAQLTSRGADQTQLKAAELVLNAEALTIGFARRFATYKRATLLFRNPERLHKILSDPDRPVQIIFAGKAHPADNAGKELIKHIVQMSQDPKFRDRIVFLENYDINVARYLVQGVDVWLNTPLRPLEASGTSGMKAAANGALNLSILDGWWAEGYGRDTGWAIGGAEEYQDPNERDYVESDAIYNLLEKEIVPLYYGRDKEDLPHGWIGMMKSAMRALGPRFSCHRMVEEYFERFYLNAHHSSVRLSENNGRRARDLAAWRSKVSGAWSKVKVGVDAFKMEHEVRAGEHVPVVIRAQLGDLAPEDVSVELYHGPVDAAGRIERGEVIRLSPDGQKDGAQLFRATVPCATSGRHGFAVRVLPKHPDVVQPFMPLHLTWGE